VVTVRLYCEKTPKVLAAADWKNPFGVHWTRTSVLEWQYQASGIDKIRVVVEPDDRLVLDAGRIMCGACFNGQKCQYFHRDTEWALNFGADYSSSNQTTRCCGGAYSAGFN
jgi:hypothetical protein